MDFDFNFTNYRTHPTNRNYEIFNFKDPERAAYFETLLVEYKILFEKDEDETEKGYCYLYAIHKKDFKTVAKLNNLTIGHFRRPFIADTYFRWIVILVGIGVVALSLIGYWVKNFG